MTNARLVVVVAATAAASSIGTAFSVSLVRPEPVGAAGGDTRIVKELRTLNTRIGNNGYDNTSVRGALHQICANGREFASTCP